MKNRNLISRNLPGWIIFKINNNTSTTYQEGSQWDIDDKPRFIDVYNLGDQDISILINDTYSFDIPIGFNLEGVEIFNNIEKVEILTSSEYMIIIRK